MGCEEKYIGGWRRMGSHKGWLHTTPTFNGHIYDIHFLVCGRGLSYGKPQLEPHF